MQTAYLKVALRYVDGSQEDMNQCHGLDVITNNDAGGVRMTRVLSIVFEPPEVGQNSGIEYQTRCFS